MTQPTGGPVFGELADVPEGTTFVDRTEVRLAGMHRAGQAGIVGTGVTGAESIVVSGGYEDDEDDGIEIIYTGHGGRQGGRQVSDQSFGASGNAVPVRATTT